MKTIKLDNNEYELIENYKDGFDLDSLKEKYTDYFYDYDYILGDWAYDKLRLKGKGLKSPSRRTTGDLFVILKVVTPTKLDRKQKKILEDLAKTNLKTSDFDLYEKYMKKNK